MAHRLDIGRIAEYRETPDGFLDLHISFSKSGPLIYQRADGTLETEYLTEDELFNEDSLATATGKPLTYLHPPEWVNKDNARKYARGSTGTKVIKDTPFAIIVATVHDGELIDIIKSGKAKQVSAGYTTKVVKGDDGRLLQTQRVYNHFSVVPVGRAGDDVRVHYDGLNVDAANFLQQMAVPKEIHLQPKQITEIPGYKKPLTYSRVHYMNRLEERSPILEDDLPNWKKPLRFSRKG
jgi:hypothetical protein